MLARLALLALSVMLPVSSSRASVIVVDPGGGPGGALLQTKVLTALNGDVLLLRPGDYTDAEITVPDKYVSLVADPPGTHVTLRRLTINLPVVGTQQVMLLRGLHIAPPAETTLAPAEGLTVVGTGTNVGVWIEDCSATASRRDPDGPGGLPHIAGKAIFVGASSPFVLVRCSGQGADGWDGGPGDSATGGGDGLGTFIALTAVHECSLTGGPGGDGVGDGSVSIDGGDGIEAVVAVSVMGCTLQGGNEGADNGADAKAGAGLHLALGTGNVRDSVVLPGQVVGAGTPNVPIQVDANSSLQSFSAATRGLSVPSPLREGEVATLSLHGAPGDGAWVHVGTGLGYKLVVPAQGVYLMGAPLPSPIFVGAITDPSGQLDVVFHMPDLPPGLDAALLFLQAVMSPASGGLVSGSGSALLWLDETL